MNIKSREGRSKQLPIWEREKVREAALNARNDFYNSPAFCKKKSFK